MQQSIVLSTNTDHDGEEMTGRFKSSSNLAGLGCLHNLGLNQQNECGTEFLSDISIRLWNNF